MWYLTFSKHLAKNICKKDQEAAEQFIENLFELAKKYFYKPLSEQDVFVSGEPDLNEIMGFIKDLYKFASSNDHRNVSLPQFARLCIALFTLHVKSSAEHLSIMSSDVIDIIKDERIRKALNIEDELIKLQVDYANRHCDNHQKRELFKAEQIRVKQGEPYDIPDVVFLKMVHRLEVQEFRRLNYNVAIHVDECAIVLGMLLSQIENEYETVLNLLAFLEPYKNSVDEFDELTAAVTSIAVCISLEEIKTPLKEYVRKGNARFLWFFNCNSLNQHVKEVDFILTQINEKKLQDIFSVIERLKQIKLHQENDELVAIIDVFEKRYMNNLSPLNDLNC
ncbi:MAG: DUF5617 domain-containing protein [Legionella sp.]|nr:DUF5617 domain-containing protein [Legionella sp.]